MGSQVPSLPSLPNINLNIKGEGRRMEHEGEAVMVDRTSATMADAGVQSGMGERTRVIDISSSRSLKKAAVMHDEPSTGAWNGRPVPEKKVEAMLENIQASMDALKEQITALPENIMASMDIRLEARMAELVKVFSSSVEKLQSVDRRHTPGAPLEGMAIDRRGPEFEDVLLKNMLLDLSGTGASSGKGRKRLPGSSKTPESADRSKGAKVVGRRLFSPKRTGQPDGQMADSHPLEIPPWIPVRFNPTKSMALTESDIALVAYAWSVDLSRQYPSEMLVEHVFAHGTREMLQCIAPGGRLVSEVITMVACMMTTKERSSPGGALRWWLPYAFTQYALKWDKDPKTIGSYYKHAFMGHVDTLLKVFIPILDSDAKHWYLMVVDLVRRELVYLDSKPCKVRRGIRERQIRRISVFLEEMFEERSYYKRADFGIPNLSSFPIVSPAKLPEQSNGVDCGIWVCRWMTLAEHWSRYDLGEVNDFARVRLLIDLITQPYNVNNERILTQAVEFMQAAGRSSPPDFD